MKNLLLTIVVALLCFGTTEAQYANISFDEEMRNFNGNEPLPAEKQIMLTGSINTNISLVEVSVFTSKGSEKRDPLYSNNWQRSEANQGNSYKIPINYKLNADNSYDFYLSYYKSLNDLETQDLYKKLNATLEAYLDQQLQMKNKSISLKSKNSKILKEMNEIVTKGLHYYRSDQLDRFDGFSDVAKGQLEKIENAKIGKAGVVVANEEKKDARFEYRNILVEELKQITRNELQFVLNANWNGIEKEYLVDNAETESRSGYFAVNVGYGAVYLGGEVDELSYGAAPYVGLSFPLSTSTIVPKFFRNASVTVGIFTKDFTEEGSNKIITGPIIKKPIYLGLDYKLFQFVRFNAGAAFLEEKTINTGQIDNIKDRVFIEPFIGLSAKINLSVSLDK